MREMPKEEAIREYGVKYVPVLQSLRLDLHARRQLSPEEALVKKLEGFAEADFSGTLRLKEEIGAPSQDFYYKDLADVEARYVAEQKKRYQETLDAINEAIMQPENSQLLAAAQSGKPEHKQLRAAFEGAYQNTILIDQFLNAGKPFTLDITPLNDTVTLPDNIAKAGDAVYIVADDGKALPSIVEGRIAKADFHASFFMTKADFSVQYDIDQPASLTPVKPEDAKFVGVDTAEDKAPAGAVARFQHKLVFNDKAAATAHMDAALNTRKRELVAQLKEIRNLRRKPFPI
ncbi:MAG: hypothetical protein PW788_07525 [Micavibrio sp.]|nr:hypothetical protein [Micavibrio sp.]